MPFPLLIPIAIAAGTAASVGLQAYDTLNKKEPIYVTTYQQTPQQTDLKQYWPLALLAGGAFVLLAVLK